MKKLLAFIFIFLISIPVIASQNCSILAWDIVNETFRLVAVDENGVVQISTSTASAAAPNFQNMVAPSGAMAGFYQTGNVFKPLICDENGALIISGGGGGGVSSLPDKVYDFPAGSFDYPNGESYEISPLDFVDGTYNRIYFHSMDDTTDEYLNGIFTLPADWDGEGITIEVYGFSSTANSGNVVFAIDTTPFNSTSSFDVALTTATSEATAMPGTVNYRAKVSISPVVSSWVAGDDIYFMIHRDADNASDTLVGDFKLTSMKVILGRSE